MTATLAPPIKQQFTNNGIPLTGGKVYTYQAGTLIPKDTYTNATSYIPNTNPIILDSEGRCKLWLDGSVGNYFIRVCDSNDVLIFDEDNVGGNPFTSSDNFIPVLIDTTFGNKVQSLPHNAIHISYIKSTNDANIVTFNTTDGSTISEPLVALDVQYAQVTFDKIGLVWYKK